MKRYRELAVWFPVAVVLTVGAVALAGRSRSAEPPQRPGQTLALAPASASPPAGAVSPAAWREVENRLRDEIEQGAFPGAVLAIGGGGRVAEIAGVGRQEWRTSSAPVLPDSTLYDLASLSKVVATTTAVMLLVDDGRLKLDDPVQRWLPGFEGQFKERVTLRHLLTHTSGLPAGTRINGTTPEEVLRRLQRTRISVPPGTQVTYSDIGYVILWAAAERAAGEPLPALLRRRVWQPLGMTQTRFVPGEGCSACAPTLHLERGERRPYRGLPADPTARRLGGIAGNAGLFSTAPDLARFSAMIANRGELDGVRILSSAAVDEMLRQQPGAGERTLGWHAYCPREERRSGEPCASPVAYGHTGYTGTSLFVDPATGRWAVLLSNRTYLPRAPSRIAALRADLWEALAE